MSFTTTPKNKASDVALKRLWPTTTSDGSTASEHTFDAIIVPDLEQPSSWNTSLVKLVSSEAPKAQIFLFHYVHSQELRSVWHSLIKAGEQLLEVLEKSRQPLQPVTRPIVFIALGLGGIALKSFIALLYRDTYEQNLLALRDAQAGSVFLGTPHPTFKRRDLWAGLTFILRASTSLGRKARVLAESDATKVANISRWFEETGLRTSILSAYEKKKTTVRGPHLLLPSKKLLVDRTFAETSAVREVLVEVNADHPGIGDLVSGSLIAENIASLIQVAQTHKINRSSSLPSSGNASSQRDIWADAASVAELSDPLESLSITDPASDPPQTNAGVGNAVAYQIIPQVLDFVRHDRIPSMPCQVRLPAANRCFIGREDALKTLESALLPDSKGPASHSLKSCAVYGLGGLGKTQLVRQFALSHQADFDAIFWVQADQEPKLAESFDHIASALNIVDPTASSDRDFSLQEVLKWLSDPKAKGCANSVPSDIQDARWLIIFDNADDIKLLIRYWPRKATKGAVLVTSRDPLIKSELNISTAIELPVLSDRESATMLRRLAEQGELSEGADDALILSQRFHGLPLAIDHLAALIRRRAMTIEEFYQSFGSQISVSELKGGAPFLQEHLDRLAISSVWRLEGFSTQSLSLLLLLSFFDPDRINESLLTLERSQIKLINYPPSPSEYLTARSQLYSASLVQRDMGKNTLSLHRLVQDMSQDSASSEMLGDGFKSAISILLHSWPDEEMFGEVDSDIPQEADQIVDHIARIKLIYSQQHDWTMKLDTRRKFVELLQRAGWYLFKISDFQSTEPFLTLSLEICETFPDDLPDLLRDSYHDLSKFTSWTNGDPKQTLSYSLRLLELCQQQNDNSTLALERIASAQSNLGMAYVAVCEYQKAITCCKASEILLKEIGDLGWPHFARIYRAWALNGLGNYQEAIEVLDGTLQYRKKHFGPNDKLSVKMAHTLYVRGYTLEKQGKARDSFNAYQNALACFTATMNQNHPSTGEVCLKLAEYHARMSQPETAEIYFEQALTVFEKDKYRKPQYARCLFKRGEFFKFMGEDNKANEAYSEASALYKTIDVTFKDDRILTQADFDAIVLFRSR